MNITPRLFNFVTISLILGTLLWISHQNNTAQEVPVDTPAAATESTATESETTPATEPAGQEETVTPVAEETATPETPAETPETPTETETTPGEPAMDDPATEPAVIDPFGEGVPPIMPEGEETPAPAHALEEAVEEPVAPNWTGIITLTVFVILLVGCYWLGAVIAKRNRLPEHGFKIFIVLLAFFGGFAALALGWNRLTLGIDLQGGVVLIYDAKPIEGSEAVGGGIDMDELTRAISRRINPGGVREIAITQHGIDKVQVVIPNVGIAESARIQRVISESGALTFRILASRAFPEDEKIIADGLADFERGRNEIFEAGRVIARWVPIFDSERSSFNDGDMVIRPRGSTSYALVKYNDGVNITGEYLTGVGRGVGDGGKPGVTFNFNAVGANKCRRLTSANLPNPAQPNRLKRHMGIVLNDSLYSAPVIQAIIGENGIITFERALTPEAMERQNRDINDLIGVLHAGALPAELSKEPASRMEIGATLGHDTIEKAKYSLASAALITILFMLFYYRLAGFIAAFCVITNTVLIVAIMLSLKAAFTLPGLAGLVLTIGMAIDANILIYERIREELKGGASLKMAIRNGYSKAFSAIFDSNITTIVIGCILYTIGSEQVKGFAVTLVLGIGLNLFTAIFCARVIMDVLATQRWLTTFRMMQLFERPNINFLSTRFVCYGFSTMLIIVGLAAVFARGRELLDIDFVGGVSVEAVFKDSQRIEDIRSRLREKDATIEGIENKLNDLSVQSIQADLDDTGQRLAPNTRFIITTSTPQVKDLSPDTYLDTVRNILIETFGDDLDYHKLDYEIASSEPDAGYDVVTVNVNMYPKTNRESLASEIATFIRRAADKEIIESVFSTPNISDITRPGLRAEELGPQHAYEDWTVTFRAPRENLEKMLEYWRTELEGAPNFPTSTTVGGSVAQHTRIQGIMAILASLVFMAIYISVRFTRWQYGLIAVVGLVHVVLVVLGLMALSKYLVDFVPPVASLLLVNEFKIGLPVVAAFLAVIAYAINDTIILFDRIRENLGKSTVLYGSMINGAINQVLSRTVLTSATTFAVAMILYVFGGQGIHAFSFAMAVGIACGTYSTIFICAPLLFWAIGKDDLSAQDKMDIEKM